MPANKYICTLIYTGRFNYVYNQNFTLTYYKRNVRLECIWREGGLIKQITPPPVSWASVSIQLFFLHQNWNTSKSISDIQLHVNYNVHKWRIKEQYGINSLPKSSSSSSSFCQDMPRTPAVEQMSLLEPEKARQWQSL